MINKYYYYFVNNIINFYFMKKLVRINSCNRPIVKIYEQYIHKANS